MTRGKPHSRRNVLKALGSTAVLTVKGSGFTAADHVDGRYKVLRKRSHENPLTAAEIKQLEKDNLDRYAKNHDLEKASITAPGDDGILNVVAFAHYIDESGMPNNYFGYSLPKEYYEDRDQSPPDGWDQGESVAKRHAAAESFLSTGDVKTTSDNNTFEHTSNWDNIEQSTSDFGECPYGRVLTDYYTYHNDTYDMSAIAGDHAYFPGINECDDIWEMYKFQVRHKWHYNTIGTSRMTDWDPSGNHDGKITSTNLEISYKDAAISWEYSQPDVSRKDYSSSDELALNYKWNGDRQASGTFDIASHNNWENPDFDPDDLILKTTQWVEFIKCGSGCLFKDFSTSAKHYWYSCGGCV